MFSRGVGDRSSSDHLERCIHDESTVLLRVRQYATNRSLWQDESSLALNIVERGFRGLLEPLDYALDYRLIRR